MKTKQATFHLIRPPRIVLAQLLLPMLLFSAVLPVARSAAARSNGEWYQECTAKKNACGYGGGGSSSSSGSSSSACQDSHEKCQEFARRGECFANPNWMLSNCQRSCAVCTEDGDENDQDCQDLHSNCPKWASQLECFTNPGYTHRACRASCWLCVDAKTLRRQASSNNSNLTEADIQHRINFSKTDWGLWQAIPVESSEDPASSVAAARVRKRIERMGKYQLELQHNGPGTVCNNLKHDCARWAADEAKDECRNNLLFMLSHCSLACEYCDVVETYYKCRPSKEAAHQAQHHAFSAMKGGLSSVYAHLVQDHHAVNLVDGSCEANSSGGSSNNNSNSNNDEWVLSLSLEALWKRDNKNGKNELIDFLRSAPDDLWMDASTVSAETDVHNHASAVMAVTPGRSGRVLRPSQSGPPQPAVVQFQMTVAELLHVPQANLEMEFVHYRHGERYKSHTDMRLHDVWKNAGVRMLSMYVVLSPAEQGGSVGFPDLDWLLVDNAEVLVWPNVKIQQESSVNSLSRMKNEQLPVVNEELYAAHIWLREYKYDERDMCA